MNIIAKILVNTLPAKARCRIRGELRHYSRQGNKTAIKLFNIWENAY